MFIQCALIRFNSSIILYYQCAVIFWILPFQSFLAAFTGKIEEFIWEFFTCKKIVRASVLNTVSYSWFIIMLLLDPCLLIFIFYTTATTNFWWPAFNAFWYIWKHFLSWRSQRISSIKTLVSKKATSIIITPTCVTMGLDLKSKTRFSWRCARICCVILFVMFHSSFAWQKTLFEYKNTVYKIKIHLKKQMWNICNHCFV